MEIALSSELLLLFFFVALIAGVIDSLAGGGGLIVLPVLLIAQIPPLQALATNKLQGTFGTLTASLTLWYKRAIVWHEIRWGVLASLIGSTLGTITVLFIDVEWLEWLIPIVLISTASYFLLSNTHATHNSQPKISNKAFHLSIIPSIGFYDGLLGPGTGSFFSFAHVALLGKSIVQATVRAKWLNFASNIASLVIFIVGGQVLWLVGGVMIAGQIIGANIGSHLILSKGNVIIRPLIVVTCFAMCAYFLWGKLS